MGRLSRIVLMSSAQRECIDRTIRSHNYCQLDAMVQALSTEGISTSRSALHRQVKKLVGIDAVSCRDENITVVILVSRATGKTDTILTKEPAAQILTRISSFKPTA